MHRRTRGRSLVLRGLAAMLALGLAACGGDDDEPAQPTSTTEAEPVGSDSIEIEYVDYGYAVSGALNAGGTIEIENSGREFHMMAVARIKPGKTLDDLTDVMGLRVSGSAGSGGGEGEPGPFATVAEQVSLPGNVMSPGAAAAVTLPDLEPGTYAILCLLRTEGDGSLHARARG